MMDGGGVGWGGDKCWFYHFAWVVGCGGMVVFFIIILYIGFFNAILIFVHIILLYRIE